MKKKKGNKALYIALASFVVFLGLFIYHAYEYFVWVQDGRVAQQNSDEMREIFADKVDAFTSLFDILPVSANQEVIVETIVLEDIPFFDISPLQMARLATGNPDIFAYIHIPETNLSNVIVQAADNDFYLHHDINRQRNSNGAVFLDYRNSFDFSDKNSVIYGHNMRNGTMFHNVRYYMQRDFFDAHGIITIITDEVVFIYQAFAAFSTMVDFDYIQVNFNNNAEFSSLISEIKRRSRHPIPFNLNYNNQILILSTCTNAHEDERFVLAAALTNKIFFLTY